MSDALSPLPVPPAAPSLRHWHCPECGERRTTDGISNLSDEGAEIEPVHACPENAMLMTHFGEVDSHTSYSDIRHETHVGVNPRPSVPGAVERMIVSTTTHHSDGRVDVSVGG